jgi:2-beta-glucuronyltransferase
MAPVERAPRRVVFLTGHPYRGQRRAGFHWLADEFRSQGWAVTFVTVGISTISVLTRDRRVSGRALQPYQGERLRTVAEWTLVHPINLRKSWLNRLTSVVFEKYYGRHLSADLRNALRNADCVVFESGPALFYFDAVRSAAPKARLVYRVSDDVRVIRNHPTVPKVEDRVVSRFNCVSVPSRLLIQRRFSTLPQARFHPHGVDSSAIALDCANPYSQDSMRVVSVGSTLLDYAFLEIAAPLFPNVEFHVFGHVTPKCTLRNVIHHGELPFAELVPYMVHAHVGLALYRREPGGEYLAETSNKIGQYRYIGLPMVAPGFLREVLAVRATDFFYANDDAESIRLALDEALACRDVRIRQEHVPSWTDVFRGMVCEAAQPN